MGVEEQAGFLRRAGGWCEAQAAGRRGLTGLSPRPLKALSTRLPPPTTRWRRGQRGSTAGEAGGEGRGEEAETKRRPPPPRNAEAGLPARGGGRAGAPAENAAGGGNGLTFSCRSRRRRPPWRIGFREAFTAGRPQARSGLSVGSLHTRGEKGRHVQRWEVQGGKPLVKHKQEEQAAITRVQVQLRTASPRAACQGPARRTGRSSDEADPRVPSDQAALCTEELRQRQGAGKGGGALGGAQRMEGGECRGRARPRSPARAHASPPHLRGGGFPESQWRATQAASPTPAHVCLSQSGGGQLRHSWDALPRSRARLCAAAAERERSWGAVNLGLGTLCLLLGKAAAGFGRRC